MQRHDAHPLRLELGEALPLESVPAPMRLSKKAAFKFWENLRPPFRVTDMEKVKENHGEKHRDGELFRVTYLCGIDYISERAYGVTSENSTFDNLCYGVATMRLPDNYPQQHLVFLSWGRPSLGIPPAKKEATVSPSTWLPIAETLKLPPGHPRLGKCRQAAREAVVALKRHSQDTSPTQKGLRGPGNSLPQLLEQEAGSSNAARMSQTGGFKVEQKRKRIYTAAAGFVTYCG